MLVAAGEKLGALAAGWLRIGFCQGNFNADNCLVGVCERVGERERERLCVREREKESVCACVCVYVYVCVAS